MAIRLKLQGLEIETDSVVEAVEIARQLSSKNGQIPEPSKEVVTDTPSRTTAGNGSPLGTYARAMLKFLLTKPNGDETEGVAKAIGVKGPKGLASPTRQIREWGKIKFGLTGEECVRREGDHTMIAETLAQKIRGHEKELLS